MLVPKKEIIAFEETANDYGLQVPEPMNIPLEETPEENSIIEFQSQLQENNLTESSPTKTFSNQTKEMN